MIIDKYINFSEVSYQIRIKSDENLNNFEIAECFKKQYPKDKCVILSGRRTEKGIEFGILIVGLNLGKQEGRK